MLTKEVIVEDSSKGTETKSIESLLAMACFVKKTLAAIKMEKACVVLQDSCLVD